MDIEFVSLFYIASVSILQVSTMISLTLAVLSVALQRKRAMLISLLYFVFSVHVTALFVLSSVCMNRDLLAQKPIIDSLKVNIAWILVCIADSLVYSYDFYRLLKGEKSYATSNNQWTHVSCCIAQGVLSYYLFTCMQCDMNFMLWQLSLCLMCFYFLSIHVTCTLMKLITRDSEIGIPTENTALNSYIFKEYT